MNRRTFLRTTLHPLRVTSVAAEPGDFPGCLRLGPQVCWAAQLCELEQIEATNLQNGARAILTVLLGREGEAVIPEGHVHGFDRGDPIALSAFVPVADGRVPYHEATLVLIDPRRNAPIEIRRHQARPVLREPSCTPPPVRRVVCEPVTA